MPRDIEEFLKMAAKRRQQQKQQGGGPRAQRPASPPPQQQPPAQTPKPARPQTRRPPVQPANEDEIIVLGTSTTKSPIDPYRQSVSEHVKSHIDTSALGEHASHLGEEVGLADDKLEARLHSTFDHSVASLESSGKVRQVGGSDDDLNAVAIELVAMLRNPNSIRHAIILNEVLTRPNFDD